MIAILIYLSSSRIKFLNEERSFIQWMRSTNQYFIGNEYHFRLGLFIARSRYIQEFNKHPGKTFTVSHNKYSCFTAPESKMLVGFHSKRNKPLKKNSEVIQNFSKPPAFLDWREKGVVNPVNEQGNCESSWAISVASTCESSFAIRKGTLFTFSVQNLIDCVTSESGCDGGSPEPAFEYVLKNQDGQFMSEIDYPYKGIQGNCLFDSAKTVGKINSFLIGTGVESDLISCIGYFGPFSAKMNADSSSFLLYSGGIYQDDSCSFWSADHSVTCVGYGNENDINYWIVKNSWGTSWGEEGYFRIVRGKYLCGFELETIFAVI